MPSGSVPPARPCSRRLPQPAGDRSKSAVEPWLAMDADFWVRRMSARFSDVAGLAAADFVGQPLFAVLGRLGIDAHAQDRMFALASGGKACFLELPAGAIGRPEDHFAVEIRPIPRRTGWVIRYVVVAWPLAAVRTAQGTPAWIETAESSPFELETMLSAFRGPRRPGSSSQIWGDDNSPA